VGGKQRVVGVKRRVWWPKKRWVWWVKRGVKRRVVVGNKHLPSQILSDGSGGWWWPKKSPSVSHFERGRGGVCREEDVGGQQNPSVSHSSARRVVRIERWWWCQTDGGGGQKSPSVLHLNEEGVVVGKRAPPSRVRATIPPPPSRWFGCAGHVTRWQWWWCGWKGTHAVATERETLSVTLLQPELVFRAREGSVVAEILLHLAFRVRDGHEGSPVDVIPSRHSK